MTDAALSDLRVLEVAEGVAAPYCGKILSDLGAEVTKLEPPGGDGSRRFGPFPGDDPHPDRSGQFLYLNAGKRSVTVDLERSEDLDLVRELTGGADVLLVDMPMRRVEALGLDYASLSPLNPRLIVTCVGPFGGVGPYRDYVGTAFTTYHSGGLGWGTPHNSVTDPDSQPPLAPGCELADYVTGVVAAADTMVALSYRDAYGVGQLVDVSGMEGVANAIRGTLGRLHATTDPLPPRRKTGFPWVSACKDGYISTSVVRDNWWRTLKEIMGKPEWAESEIFDTSPGRMENADALELLVNEWLLQHNRDEIYQLALSHHMPGFPVLSIPELLQSPQLRARKSFVEVEHPLAGKMTQPGPAAQYARTPATVRGQAPRLGEHNDEVRGEPHRRGVAAGDGEAVGGAAPARAPAGNLPLSGIRVADFGWILSVPHATAWLGTLGAEVIRIESQTNPDQLRAGGMNPAQATDGITGINRSASFNSLNFGKKSVTLNLRDPAGVALAKEIVRRSDVVTENFSAGTMDRLGLGYETLSELKPDILMMSGSALGNTGPEREATGWGPNSMAVAGVPYLTGYVGGPPASLDGSFPDFLIGTQMAQVLLAAIHERRRTGKGQYIDVSMAETVLAMVPEPVIDYAMNGRESLRRGNRHPAMAPQGVYRCSGDDQWVAISVAGDEQWQGLRRALGNPAWATDAAYDSLKGRIEGHDAIDAGITTWTREREHYEVMHCLQAEAVAAVPVLDAEAVARDPQMQALGYMVEIDHEVVGKRVMPGIPGRFSAMPQLDYRGSPLLGEHNEEVFCGLLDLPRERFDELVAAEVIY